jgi:hypothetical protein
MGELVMVGNWWHVAHTPDGIWAHQIDPVEAEEQAQALMAQDPELGYDEAVAEVLGDVAAGIRAELGFPPKGRWVTRAGWDSQLTLGEPHPKLLAKATVVRS